MKIKDFRDFSNLVRGGCWLLLIATGVAVCILLFSNGSRTGWRILSTVVAWEIGSWIVIIIFDLIYLIYEVFRKKKPSK